MQEPLVEPDCPIACPNRQKVDAQKKGSLGACVLTLFFGFLMLTFSYERSPDGSWQPRSEPPFAVIVLLTAACCTCMGVTIPSDAIGKLLGK